MGFKVLAGRGGGRGAKRVDGRGEAVTEKRQDAAAD